jgi:hypothetical protein
MDEKDKNNGRDAERRTALIYALSPAHPPYSQACRIRLSRQALCRHTTATWSRERVQVVESNNSITDGRAHGVNCCAGIEDGHEEATRQQRRLS